MKLLLRIAAAQTFNLNYQRSPAVCEQWSAEAFIKLNAADLNFECLFGNFNLPDFFREFRMSI